MTCKCETMLQVRRTLDEGVREDISYEDAQESKKKESK